MEAEPHPAHSFDLFRLTSPRGSPSAIARDRREAGLPPALTDPLPLYQRPFSSPVDGSVQVFALVVSHIGLATVNQFRHVQAFIREYGGTVNHLLSLPLPHFPPSDVSFLLIVGNDIQMPYAWRVQTERIFVGIPDLVGFCTRVLPTFYHPELTPRSIFGRRYAIESPAYWGPYEPVYNYRAERLKLIANPLPFPRVPKDRVEEIDRVCSLTACLNAEIDPFDRVPLPHEVDMETEQYLATPDFTRSQPDQMQNPFDLSGPASSGGYMNEKGKGKTRESSAALRIKLDRLRLGQHFDSDWAAC